MNHMEFARTVAKMRSAQKRCSKTASKTNIEAKERAEREVDIALEKMGVEARRVAQLHILLLSDDQIAAPDGSKCQHPYSDELIDGTCSVCHLPKPPQGS